MPGRRCRRRTRPPGWRRGSPAWRGTLALRPPPLQRRSGPIWTRTSHSVFVCATFCGHRERAGRWARREGDDGDGDHSRRDRDQGVPWCAGAMTHGVDDFLKDVAPHWPRPGRPGHPTGPAPPPPLRPPLSAPRVARRLQRLGEEVAAILRQAHESVAQLRTGPRPTPRSSAERPTEADELTGGPTPTARPPPSS